MTIAAVALGVAASFTVSLKLFTFEYYFADDASCGVALRTSPGFGNKRRVDNSSELRGKILIEDENDFRGSGLYHALTGWGFLPSFLLLGLGAAFFGVLRRRARD